MSTTPSNHTAEIPVAGAFEEFEATDTTPATRDEMLTLTRNGRLMQVGDMLPFVPEGMEGRAYILQILNQAGTETCTMCMTALDDLRFRRPEVPVITLTEGYAEGTSKEQYAGKAIFQIGREVAIDLGVQLEPAEGSDPFWSAALLRTVAVVDADGVVKYVDQPLNQGEILNFDGAYEAYDATTVRE